MERSRTQVSDPEQGWLDLQEIATLEITSEDPNFPIDSVFSLNPGPGWRASQKGEQQIRIIFDQPISVRRIQLHFLEPELERTQDQLEGALARTWLSPLAETPGPLTDAETVAVTG